MGPGGCRTLLVHRGTFVINPSGPALAHSHGRWRARVPRSASGCGPDQVRSGTCSSAWAISSIETSLKVRILADFTNRTGRYMSQIQASPRVTS